MPTDTLAHVMRRAVRELCAAAGPLRTLPHTLHVGLPGADHPTAECAEVDEIAGGVGLRADVVSRILTGNDAPRAPYVWLTRSGELEPAGDDLSWYAAARQAFGWHGIVLPAFCLVSRREWIDLVSGAGQRWRRIRLDR